MAPSDGNRQYRADDAAASHLIFLCLERGIVIGSAIRTFVKTASKTAGAGVVVAFAYQVGRAMQRYDTKLDNQKGE